VGFEKSRNFFPEIILPTKLRMHIFPCPSAVEITKKIWIQTYFEPVTVDSVEIFHHFAFWRHGSKLVSFFVVPKNCIFLVASFKLIKNLATLDPEKLQRFYGTLLYHCYTLATERKKPEHLCFIQSRVAHHR
jgi:hypothetical protein